MKAYEWGPLTMRAGSRYRWADTSEFFAVTMPKSAVRIHGTADGGYLHGWAQAIALCKKHVADAEIIGADTVKDLVAAYEGGDEGMTFALVDAIIEMNHPLASAFTKLQDRVSEYAAVKVGLIPFDRTFYVGDVIDGMTIVEVSRKMVYVCSRWELAEHRQHVRIRHWNLRRFCEAAWNA
jgi:hypothetical protein